MTSPLHQLTYSLCVPHEQGSGETRFVLLSSVVNATWNLELGSQGVRDRWWRGSHPLPEEIIQTEIESRWYKGIIQVLGWCEDGSDACVLKIVLNLSQTHKLRICLKEYEPEVASTQAMRILLNLFSSNRNISPIPTRSLRNISATDIHLREREQTIQELRRKIASLEKELESRPPPTISTVTLVAPSMPKRRRIVQVKDMRFDGE
ncbi:hypothetical protein RSOLAG1IB_04121 [Rhizoctonia solani AG-1 IB]|uniref:Uncharacterized protein n=1 Tax=Thanatephorus cucumeris (strain AG1-IB / isolate 7/3/14) TaxID=1108050 RepID=A0A0B7FXF9_THACB|nr:hypothetical protein RSOLAG1IB_04121 [Rhizoctonia solani AG-1 IB]